MIRWGAVVAGVFAAGLAAGLLFSGVQASVAPKSPTPAPAPDNAAVEKLRAEVKRLEDERAALAARNDALETEAATMRNDQSLMDDVLKDAAKPDDAPPTEASAQPPQPGGRPESEWRRGGGQRPTPEQMAEFRKNYEAQQTRMQERLNEQLTAMNDPNAVENFNTLMEYQQSEQELRQQLRNAKTDDARAKIEAQLDDTRQAARQLLQDQQNAMLQRLASSSGINSSDAQQKFVNDLRATLDNPFFRMEPMLRGGGPGGGPGRGGPRGGGFGAPRGATPN